MRGVRGARGGGVRGARGVCFGVFQRVGASESRCKRKIKTSFFAWSRVEVDVSVVDVAQLTLFLHDTDYNPTTPIR